MTNYNDIRIVEAEILKKIHVFRLFKQQGQLFIEKNFPNLLDFVLIHQERTIDEFENEQMLILDQFCELG